MDKRTLMVYVVAFTVLGCGKTKTLPWQASIQQAEITGAEFTYCVAMAIREAIPHANVNVDKPLKITVELDTGHSLCNLDNAWLECATEPEIRIDVVMRHVEALKTAFAAGAGHHLDLKDIVPIVKDKTWIDEVTGQGMQVYREQLAADLFVTYAVDGSNQLRFVDQHEFAAFDLPVEEIRKHALSNLVARLPKVERLGQGPLYMLAAGGTFESSLLLLSSIWGEQAKAVDGRVVVAVPSRELLLFTGENAHEAVQQMRSIVADIQADGNYLISETILVRDQDRWVPLVDE